MFQKKSCTENQNTILCSVTFFSENRAVYEILWKNPVVPENWLTKSIDPCSEYVILFIFTRQQWLNKHVSMLGL
jgi:hypothetical protein